MHPIVAQDRHGPEKSIRVTLREKIRFVSLKTSHVNTPSLSCSVCTGQVSAKYPGQNTTSVYFSQREHMGEKNRLA